MPDRRAVQLRNELVTSRNRAQAGLDAVRLEEPQKHTDPSTYEARRHVWEDRVARLDQTVKVHDAFVRMVDVAFGINTPPSS